MYKRQVVNPDFTDEKASDEMKMLVEIIRTVRNIRAEVNTPLSKKIKLSLNAKDAETQAVLEKNSSYIERFCNPEELTIGTDIPADDKAMTAIVTGVELILPLQGLLNIEEEQKRLQKELEKWKKEVERIEKKLSNEGFMKKAPEKVIEEEKAKLADYVEKREAVQGRLKDLEELA